MADNENKYRLQLRSHKELFPTREAALEYLNSNAKFGFMGKFGEPVLLFYGDNPGAPNMILAVCSSMENAGPSITYIDDTELRELIEEAKEASGDVDRMAAILNGVIESTGLILEEENRILPEVRYEHSDKIPSTVTTMSDAIDYLAEAVEDAKIPDIADVDINHAPFDNNIIGYINGFGLLAAVDLSYDQNTGKLHFSRSGYNNGVFTTDAYTRDFEIGKGSAYVADNDGKCVRLDIDNVGNVISADVNMNNGDFSMEQVGGNYVITLKLGPTAKSVRIPAVEVIESASYNAVENELVIKFSNGQTVRVPVSGLINEFGVDNTNKNVEMSMTVAPDGKTNFSANVKVERSVDNMIGENANHELVVRKSDVESMVQTTVSEACAELDREKVDKVDGMGLSSNDFTDELKSKLENATDKYISQVSLDGNYLVFVYNDGTEAGRVELSAFKDIYTEGDAIKIDRENGNKISVFVNPESESFLSADAAGLKVTGVANAINNATNGFVNGASFDNDILVLRTKGGESINVDLSSLDDEESEYTALENGGITIADHKVSIKLDETAAAHEDFLKLSNNGLRTEGINSAIESAVNDAMEEADLDQFVKKADVVTNVAGITSDNVNPISAKTTKQYVESVWNNLIGMIDGKVGSVVLVDNGNMTYTLKVDGEDAGTINIPQDQFIKSVTYDPVEHTLVFEWEGPIPATVVPIGDLVDTYTAAENGGLNLDANNAFSIKLDTDDDVYLKLTGNGELRFDERELDSEIDSKTNELVSNVEFNSSDDILKVTRKNGETFNVDLGSLADNYELPVATSDTLGGVKIGGGLAISNGVVSVLPDDAMSASSTNAVQNKIVKAALDAKQDAIASSNTVEIATVDGVVRANVKIDNSSDNMILANANGVFASVDVAVNSSTNQLTLFVNGVAKTVNLPGIRVVDGSAYNSETKELVITFTDGSSVTIPLDDLLPIVENPVDSPVVLSLTDDGALSADLKVSENDNALKVDNRGNLSVTPVSITASNAQQLSITGSHEDGFTIGINANALIANDDDPSAGNNNALQYEASSNSLFVKDLGYLEDTVSELNDRVEELERRVNSFDERLTTVENNVSEFVNAYTAKINAMWATLYGAGGTPSSAEANSVVDTMNHINNDLVDFNDTNGNWISGDDGDFTF